MPTISLPRADSYLVVTERVPSNTYDKMLSLRIHRAKPYTHEIIDVPLEVGEWYQIKNVIYLSKNRHERFNRQPLLTLKLNRGKRKWVKQKLTGLIQDTVSEYEKWKCTDLNFYALASDVNGRCVWVETELEAKRMREKLLGEQAELKSSPRKKRWGLIE